MGFKISKIKILFISNLIKKGVGETELSCRVVKDTKGLLDDVEIKAEEKKDNLVIRLKM